MSGENVVIKSSRCQKLMTERINKSMNKNAIASRLNWLELVCIHSQLSISQTLKRQTQMFEISRARDIKKRASNKKIL